jgi:hypothetical protein
VSSDFIGTARGTKEDAPRRPLALRFATFGVLPEHIIDPPEPHDTDAWWRLLELMHQKDQKLPSGRWFQCERRIILVIILIDAAIGGVTAGTETDRPKEDGFDEVWLADYTQVEAFGGVDLFAIVHPKLEGRFATGDYGQKPFG